MHVDRRALVIYLFMFSYFFVAEKFLLADLLLLLIKAVTNVSNQTVVQTLYVLFFYLKYMYCYVVVKQVFKDLDFLGWYNTGELNYESDIQIHKQVTVCLTSFFFTSTWWAKKRTAN